MRISVIALSLSALTLTGCASTLPRSLAGPDPISANEILGAIDCDLNMFVVSSRYENVLKTWNGVANLDVTNTRDFLVKPSADFTAAIETPVVPVGVKVSPSHTYKDVFI